PPTPNDHPNNLTIGIFGPGAEEVTHSPELLSVLNSSECKFVSLIPIPSDIQWGKASNELVKAVYQDHVAAIIALDRDSSHLAEQIGVKSFVPVIAISSDRALTSTNIPWIFRLPQGTTVQQAVRVVLNAASKAGPNRSAIRETLASGESVAGIRFEST